MTSDRNLERLLDAWFADGPMQVSDRAFDEAVGRVQRQPQRPAWRLRSWRFPTMSTPFKLVAIGAALLAVVLGGAMFLGGGAGPSPTPSPAPSPTPAPTPTLSPTVSSEPSPRTASGQVQGDPLRFTYTAPAGWASGGWAFTTLSRGFPGPNGIGVGASGAVNVPTDPCDGVGKHSDATSAEAVVADLRARDDLVVSDAQPTTLGGLTGLRVDVQVPADLSACADAYVVFAEPDGSGFYVQGPSNLLDLWILDTEGGPIWVQIEHFAGTPAEDYADAQALVSSIVFTP